MVGFLEGRREGANEGAFVVGSAVGRRVGDDDTGARVGMSVGSVVGCAVGKSVGPSVGVVVGEGVQRLFAIFGSRRRKGHFAVSAMQNGMQEIPGVVAGGESSRMRMSAREGSLRSQND